MSLVGTRPPTVDEYEQYEIGHRKRLKIPKEYDKYLHHMYGNYMDIPPKEKREQHVVLKYQVYWN